MAPYDYAEAAGWLWYHRDQETEEQLAPLPSGDFASILVSEQNEEYSPAENTVVGHSNEPG
jgi:hypothetical protein